MTDDHPANDPPSAEGTSSHDRVLMVILSYLWLLAIVPLLFGTRDPDVQWHAKHGLVLTALELLLLTAWTMTMSVLWIVTGGLLGCLFPMLSPLLVLAIVVLHAVAIVKALSGRRLIVPGVSEYASRF